jgi:hypothetical protein
VRPVTRELEEAPGGGLFVRWRMGEEGIRYNRGRWRGVPELSQVRHYFWWPDPGIIAGRDHSSAHANQPA